MDLMCLFVHYVFTTLNMNVLDENDDQPQFSQQSYQVCVTLFQNLKHFSLSVSNEMLVTKAGNYKIIIKF